MNKKTNSNHVIETQALELRRLQAETMQAERNLGLLRRTEHRDWIKTIAIIGAAVATLIKVVAEL